MWVFTEVADWFSNVRQDNEKFLEQAMRDADAGSFAGVMIYGTAAIGWFLNKVPGAVADGFVDVLRVGDGFQEGGWGVGKDALRLLMIVGPALRAARWGIALVATVDEMSTVGNCTWVAGARVLRVTGVRHFARIGDLARAAGIDVKATTGLWPKELMPFLQKLGADVQTLGKVSSLEQVVALAKQNPNGTLVFCVRFQWALKRAAQGPQTAFLEDQLHTLLATRNAGGAVRIIDRSGKVYSSLAGLEKAYQAETGFGAGMTIATEAETILVRNATIVDLVNASTSVAWVLNALALEIRSVPSLAFLEGNQAPITLKSARERVLGWWTVRTGSFLWVYVFEPSGTVRWLDPYNKKGGAGQWKEANGNLSISWSGSATKESWTVPDISGPVTVTQSGNAQAITAEKIFASDVDKIAGKWRVVVDKWNWQYEFDRYGHVKWTDGGQSGSGTWWFTPGSIYINWAPKSGTREDWTWPLEPANQSGEYRASYGNFKVEAAKIGR